VRFVSRLCHIFSVRLFCRANNKWREAYNLDFTPICASSPTSNHLLPPTIMPFNAAQLTAFWTDNAQMALSHCTRGQMAAEGLIVPADFVDFAKKEELEALLKCLYKPAKTTHGVGAALVLREVQAYEVPARLVVCLHGCM
jgi:hypothetical protein